MADRTLANRIYDRARQRTLEDLIDMYPERFRALLDELVEQYRTPGHEIHTRFAGHLGKCYDRARRDAMNTLRTAHPGAYLLLMEAHQRQVRAEVGYVDGRPAANAARGAGAPRGSGGRFTSAA